MDRDVRGYPQCSPIIRADSVAERDAEHIGGQLNGGSPKKQNLG